MGRKLTVGLAIIIIVLLAFLIGFIYFIETYYTPFTGSEETSGQGEQTGESTNGQTPATSTPQGKLGVGVVIQFVNGRAEDVDPSQIRFTLFPLTVYVGGEEVAKITWRVYLYLDWGDKQLTCLEVKGPLTAKAGSVVLRKEDTWKKTGVNFEMPQKASYFVTWQMPLEAGDISYSLGCGDYTITTTADMTMILTFSDGSVVTRQASASTDVQVRVGSDMKLCAFTVNVQVSALR